MSNLQSLVWSALKADDWVCRKPAEIGWAGLGGAGLQHIVSAAKDFDRCSSIPRVSGAAAPSDPLLSYDLSSSCAKLEQQPGTAIMLGCGGGRSVPLLVNMDRL